MKKGLARTVASIIILLFFMPYQSFRVYADIKEYSIPQEKSMFLFVKGTAPQEIIWESSNQNIATVSSGVVYAKSEGQAIVTAKLNNQSIMTYKINVTKPDGIKFTYTYPNNPSAGESVELIAITNTSIDGVKFQLNINSKVNTLLASTKQVEENTYVWKANVVIPNAGKFHFKTEFLKNGVWQSDSSGDNNILAVNNKEISLQQIEQKRVSNKCIDLIASCEGFVKEIHKDKFAKATYDIGYGYVIRSGKSFYNGITEREAFAQLCKSLNRDYSKDVNDFLINNNIKFNQYQFDALVSFTYNLGTSWMINSNFKNSILECKNSRPILKGIVTYRSGINVRSQPDIGSKVLKVLKNGSELTLQSSQKYNKNWYQVRMESGEQGFCFDEGLSPCAFGQTGIGELSNVDREIFSKCMLVYHHAGGKCVQGLMYRRIDELEMFFFGDYLKDGQINKYGFLTECIR
ncbi:MAG: hypothetical protein RUMPE_00214 [Eubacteriales bacterium SKADARSKE-1]|nr:hypothetical protein [Eubacteriales bacterium SKADARSKE-1]